MSLELVSGDGDPIPTTEETAAEVMRLGRVVSELRETIGQPSKGQTPASGMAGQLDSALATLGHAPNDATGDPGSGLCRVVAQLAQAHGLSQNRVIAGATIGSASVVAVIEILLQIARALG